MQKNLNSEKITFKMVLIKFLTMHITYQILSFDVGHLQNILIEHDLYFVLIIFCHKRKIYNFDPYNVFLAIPKKITQRLKTGFVAPGSQMYLHLSFYDNINVNTGLSNLMNDIF